ncbi:MAG: ATP-binding protein [Candidatus Woykebacteria bacterium]
MFTDLSLIFDFQWNVFSLTSLLSVIINLFLLVLVRAKGPKNESTNWFILVLILLIIWGISEFLDRNSASQIASLFWDYVGRPGWILVTPVLFGFALHFVGQENILKNRFNQLLIFGPFILVLFFSWNTNLIINNDISAHHRVYYGWSITPLGSFFEVFTLLFILFLTASVVLLTRFYLGASDLIKRRQALFIMGAFLIPIIGGIFTDAIFPILGIQIVPIAIILTTAMTISVTYTIIRYSLFVVSPTLAASTIIDTISEALLVIRPNQLIEQVNKATIDLIGLKKNELIGANIQRIMPDDETWNDFREVVLKPLREKDLVLNFKTKFKTKEGKTVPVSFSGVSLKDIGGLISIVGLARNLAKEEEFEQMKLDFVSIAAHELRTPLTSIRGYLSVLQEEVKGKISEEQSSFLDKAFISSNQLEALVENLLSVSRIERGAMQLEKSSVDWEELVSSIVTTYLVRAKGREIDIYFKTPEKKLPKIYVDKFRISEVLYNLIDNALTHTEAGGSVEVSSGLDGDHVVTYVKDTGEGIPPDALPKLFTKFFRVSGVLEQGSKGTGLGLYISKAIVEMHKGKIWVESTPGVGSTFSFSIPVKGEKIEPEFDKFKELGLTHAPDSNGK